MLLGYVGAAATKSVILGVWADGWEKLTIVPILVIIPLTFCGFRWSFYENADVAVGLSLGMNNAEQGNRGRTEVFATFARADL